MDFYTILRLYMLVGGMPQAVNAYLDTNNFSKVDQVKRRLLKLYEDDFQKIDPSGRASVMFRSIPGQLSRNAIRYVPSCGSEIFKQQGSCVA